MKNANGEHPDLKMSVIPDNVTDRGTVKLHEGVISSVIKNAVSTVPGIVRLGGVNSLSESMASLMGKKNSDNAVIVEVNEDKVKAEIKFVAEYGCNIPTLALNAQITVIQKVKEITGMDVTSIDIHVTGVESVNREETKSSQTEEQKK